MEKFDPASMPNTVSPVVRELRIFVETTIDDEVEAAEHEYGKFIAEAVQKSLKNATHKIFHRNPDVHNAVGDNIHAYDAAITALFGIEAE